MGNVNKKEVQDTLTKGLKHINELKKYLKDSQTVLLQELADKGYLTKPSTNFQYNGFYTLCQRLIYIRVTDFIANLEPKHVDDINYILGLKIPNKHVDSLPPFNYNMKQICNQLTDFVFKKVTLVQDIDSFVSKCDKDLVKVKKLKIGDKNLKRIQVVYNNFLEAYEYSISRADQYITDITNATTVKQLRKTEIAVANLKIQFEELCDRFYNDLNTLINN